MNHLESSFAGKNNLWRYVIMIAAIFAATNAIGSLPFAFVSMAATKNNPEALSEISSNLNYLTDLGIDKNLLLVLMLIPFLVGIAAYALLINPLHGRKFLDTITGAGRIRWKRMLVAGAVWMILMAVYLIVYIIVDPENFTINNNSLSLIVLAMLSFLLIPFQAAFEEILFRGYLMQGFTLVISRRIFPLIITAVFFALMHSLNPEVKEFGFLSVMPQYLAFGLIFGIVTILDDGIEMALGAHAANNIFLCIMVTQKSSALQTVALYEQHNYYPWLELAGLIISGVVFILVMKRIYGFRDLSFLVDRVEAKRETVQTP
jgi:membrane protease YdiL (CAAX protease family)